MAMTRGRPRRSTRSSSAAARRPGSTPAQLERLLAMVRRWFPLAAGGEWTVEANPGTLDAEKADVLAAGGREPGQPRCAVVPAGVARGPRAEPRARGGRAGARAGPAAVPALVVRPDLRRPRLDAGALGRRPRDGAGARARRTSRATAWSTRRGPRSGSSGRPGRSARSTRKPSGRCTSTRSTGSTAAGLAMYEISNFARPGHESRHNLVYWANDAYFGVGLGAARYVGGRPVGQHPRPARLPPADRGRRAGDRADRDPRPRGARPRDRRPDAPADRRSASTATTSPAGPASTSTRSPARPSRGASARGLLEDDGRRVRFTREGLFLADTVLCELL